MKKASLWLLVFVFLFSSGVRADEAYLNRFLTYWQYQQQLSTLTPDAPFYAFIQSEGYLASKLRAQWLFLQAKHHQWQAVETYYRPSKNTSLQCMALHAAIALGHTNNVLAPAKALWLHGRSMPKACDPVFAYLLSASPDKASLLTQRLIKALQRDNVGLAIYLLKQYPEPQQKEAALLNAIHRDPRNIRTLTPSLLHEWFYLYGLKRLVSMNLDTAVAYFNAVKAQHHLSEPIEQRALAKIALYKALRNQKDAQMWFDQVKPAYYTPVLLDWEFRNALKHQQWDKILSLMNANAKPDAFDDAYWKARALEATGQKDAATALYRTLAGERNYYGFLASMRLGVAPTFEEQPAYTHLSVLNIYQPVLEQIKGYFKAGDRIKASIVISDFFSELPEKEQSAFAYWVAHELEWYGKTVHLSSTKALYNQLSLRFPTAYHAFVKKHAKSNRLPEPLVYAMIRQESAFRKDVVSSAGARGLMQLMPETAKRTARSAGIRYRELNDLFEPKINIALGTAYLKQLAQHYNQRYILMIAAYNAGPKQVHYWQTHHPKNPTDIWIETLPWRETRNYLKNVLAFYVVYQHRLGQKVNLEEMLADG